MTESPSTQPTGPSLRERIGVGVLVVALVLAPVAATKPDLGAAIAVLAAAALTVFARTPPPVWAHAPRLAKLGAIVAAWGVLALGFDRMTLAGTPPAVLPTIIAVGAALCAAAGLGWARLTGLLDGPLPLRPNHEEDRQDGH